MNRLSSFPKLLVLGMTLVIGLILAPPSYAQATGPVIIGPTNGDVVNSAQAQLEWTALPGIDAYVITVYSDSDLTSEAYFFFTPQTTTHLTIIGQEGTYWWRVLGLTAEGEPTEWSSVGFFSVDNTTPTVQLTNSPGTSEGLIDFTASYQDTNLEKYWLEVTNSSGSVIATSEPVFTSKAGENQPVYTFDTRGLAEDFYTITMYVQDSANNVVTANILLFVENIAPTEDYQCKKDGWQNYGTFKFKNQGQCIKYINHL